MNDSSALDPVVRDPVVAELVAHASQAHAALMRGDVQTYLSHITVSDDFVLMAPFGGTPSRDVEWTGERWASVGRFFAQGRDSTLELVRAWRGADIVVLSAIERTHVEVGALAGQHWSLRVTLVFRWQEDRWLLAHRHADPLVAGISVEQAAALAGERP